VTFASTSAHSKTANRPHIFLPAGMNGSITKEKSTVENGPVLSATENQNLGNPSNVIYQKSTNDVSQIGILKRSWIKASELSRPINRVPFAKGNIRPSACKDI
jgi:hypothetical protein